MFRTSYNSLYSSKLARRLRLNSFRRASASTRVRRFEVAVAVALVAVILLPQPGEEPVAEEPADPAEDDFEYWNQLRRARGWSEVVATIPRQRHGAAAPHAPAKDRPKRKKRRAVSSSGTALGAAATAAAARTAAPMERLEAAAAVAKAAAEIGEAKAAVVAPGDLRMVAAGARVAEEEMVEEASATAEAAEEELEAAAAAAAVAAAAAEVGAAAAAAEVVMEAEADEGLVVARTHLQACGSSDSGMGLPADAILEPAAERLQIRLAPRPVTLRQHTRRLGSDAESREQPDTLQKLDLVRGGGMVPTAYGMKTARAEQAAGVASKLTISLRPRGAPFGAAGEGGSASAAERHAADAAAAEGGEAEAAGTKKKKKKKGRRRKK